MILIKFKNKKELLDWLKKFPPEAKVADVMELFRDYQRLCVKNKNKKVYVS